MAASSTVMFTFAFLAEEKPYLPSSTFGNTSTAVCEGDVRSLFCRFILNWPDVDL